MSSNAKKIRLQIAYFSPLPPAKSGIADYSSELLPYLARYADLTLFTAVSHEIGADLAEKFPVLPIQEYPEKRWQFDIPLYQMGNSSHHEAIYQMLLRYPGIVTLHDHSLYHFVTQRTVGSNHFAGYLRELGYELGQQGIELGRQIETGGQKPSLHDTPLNRRLLDLSLGVIVHSRHVQHLILSQRRETAVTVIPHQMRPLTGESLRRHLPWPNGAVIFASAGQVTAAKQTEFALRAFKKVHQTNPTTYYLIIGEEMPGVDVAGIIHSLDLTDSVLHIGYIADKQAFIDWIYTADIIINLRHPTIGETSGTALRALAAGRPLIVFDHGWYSELPDSACLKVPPLDESALFTAMSQLAQHPKKRQQLGESGQLHIKREHDPDHVAQAYIAFMRQQLSSLQHKYGN